LKQIDAVFPSEEPSPLPQDSEIEPIETAEVESEDLPAPEFVVGSKCRFRHRDGRWYNGQIIGFEGNSSALVSFLNPISENMMVSLISFIYAKCFIISVSLSMLFLFILMN
jgi:hypothetical protein